MGFLGSSGPGFIPPSPAAGGVDEPPPDGKLYARSYDGAAGHWTPTVDEAPIIEGTAYARESGGWITAAEVFRRLGGDSEPPAVATPVEETEDQSESSEHRSEHRSDHRSNRRHR